MTTPGPTLLTAAALAQIPSISNALPPHLTTVPTSTRTIRPIPRHAHTLANERSLDTLPLSRCSQIIATYHFDATLSAGERASKILALAGGHHSLPQTLSNHPFHNRLFLLVPPPAPSADFHVNIKAKRIERGPPSVQGEKKKAVVVVYDAEELWMNEVQWSEEAMYFNGEVPPRSKDPLAGMSAERKRQVWEEQTEWMRLEAGMCVMRAVIKMMERFGGQYLKNAIKNTSEPNPFHEGPPPQSKKSKSKAARKKPTLVLHLGGPTWGLKGEEGTDFELVSFEKFLSVVDAVGDIEVKGQ